MGTCVRVEYSDPFYFYIGRRVCALTHLLFYLCLLTQNIASIVFTAQARYRARSAAAAASAVAARRGVLGVSRALLRALAL